MAASAKQLLVWPTQAKKITPGTSALDFHPIGTFVRETKGGEEKRSEKGKRGKKRERKWTLISLFAYLYLWINTTSWKITTFLYFFDEIGEKRTDPDLFSAFFGISASLLSEFLSLRDSWRVFSSLLCDCSWIFMIGFDLQTFAEFSGDSITLCLTEKIDIYFSNSIPSFWLLWNRKCNSNTSLFQSPMYSSL